MPNPKTNLIVFGEDWGGLPSSTQHLIRNMPNRGKTLWFNSIGMRAPTPTLNDAKRVMQKVRARIGAQSDQASAFSATTPLDNMTIVEPRSLPWHSVSPIQRWNANQWRKQIEPFLETCDTPPVLWITVPTAAPVLNALPDLPSVYYCCDDFSTLPGVDHAAAQAAEAQLGQQADVIIVTNPLLADKFPEAKTKYVPQGVDYDLFATPTERAPDMPTGKVAGFFGLLAEWVDQDLIIHAARALANDGWTFLIIGNANVNTDRLAAEPNIMLTGPKPYSDLPRYAQHWDVSLLPFADTPEVRASNPLKLREYLAAGPAVVTTDFPAAQPYHDVLDIVSDKAAFTNAILKAENAEHAVHARRHRVADESWGARAQDIITAPLLAAQSQARP